MDRIDVFDAPSTNIESTPQGGIRVPANLTRTGVFRYAQPDGSVIRELRHPEDVFDAISLSTLADAPLTLGHPGMVSAESWSSQSIGHVRDIGHGDKFVTAKAIVQDAKAVKKVRAKELVEVSCGYACDMVPGKGTYDGEEYDARQTNIRYNHVGIGPSNWGRAGADVRLRVDGYYLDPMDPKELEKLRQDAADAVRLRQDADALRLDAAKARAELDIAKANLDTVTAERDTLKADAAGAVAKFDAAVKARLAVLDGARKVLGEVDATKSDSDLIVATIVKSDAKFDAADRSADYLRARFDLVVANYVAADGVLAGANAVSGSPGNVADEKQDAVGSAYENMRKRNEEASKKAGVL